MSEASPAQNELSEVDQLYKSLAARDPRRPGEWARRKVQAYAAQQAAERALRESAEARGNSVAPAAPPAKASPAAKGNTVAAASPVAPAPKRAPVEAAAKKPLVKPLALVVTLVAVAVVAIVGFLILPSIMGSSSTPRLESPIPVAQVAPNSVGAGSSAPPRETAIPEAPSQTSQASDPDVADSAASESPAASEDSPAAPAETTTTAAATEASAPTLPAATPAASRSSTSVQPGGRHVSDSAARTAAARAASTAAHAKAATAAQSTASVNRQSAPLTQAQGPTGSPASTARVASATQQTSAPTLTSSPTPAPAPALTSAPALAAAPTATSAPPPAPGSGSASGSGMAAASAAPASAPAAGASIPPEGFWRAAQNGDAGGLQDALVGNVDVNALDAKGHRALILAIEYGHVDIVRTLLSHGANPNMPDSHGATPLSAAHARGNFEILALLQRNGVR